MAPFQVLERQNGRVWNGSPVRKHHGRRHRYEGQHQRKEGSR